MKKITSAATAVALFAAAGLHALTLDESLVRSYAAYSDGRFNAMIEQFLDDHPITPAYDGAAGLALEAVAHAASAQHVQALSKIEQAVESLNEKGFSDNASLAFAGLLSLFAEDVRTRARNVTEDRAYQSLMDGFNPAAASHNDIDRRLEAMGETDNPFYRIAFANQLIENSPGLSFPYRIYKAASYGEAPFCALQALAAARNSLFYLDTFNAMTGRSYEEGEEDPYHSLAVQLVDEFQRLARVELSALKGKLKLFDYWTNYEIGNGNYARARALTQQYASQASFSIECYPEDPELHFSEASAFYLRAQAYRYEGVQETADASKMRNNYSRAVASAEKTIELNPKAVAAYNMVIEAYTLYQEYTNALHYLHRVVELVPNDPDYYFLMGQIYDEQQNSSAAVRYFRKVLELKPDHPQATAIKEYIAANE